MSNCDGIDNLAQDEHNNDANVEIDEISSTRPSNKKLLCIAFVSFQSFSALQLVAALWAGSEAMLGDSIAMMIDSLSYLFNMVAERQKEHYATRLRQQYTSSSTIGITEFMQSKMILEYRKYTYQLELVPPLVSVVTLLVLTVMVLRESIHTLILDFQKDDSAEVDPSRSDPNVDLMFLFSCINLILDLINVGCFASASHGLGYNTHRDEDRSDYININTNNASPSFDVANNGEPEDFSMEDDNECDFNTEENDSKDDGFEKVTRNCPTSRQGFRDQPSGDTTSTKNFASHKSNDRFEADSTNLNMCSAYTHVFADTVRSICVIIASLLAKFVTAITPEMADAGAAVIVSILIFLTIFPLFGGMMQTFKSLKDVNESLMLKEKDESEEEDQVELLGFVQPKIMP